MCKLTVKNVTALLRELKTQISDEYRASDDPNDDTPAMSVTLATTDGKAFTYQTGDNSFSGACYGHAHWHTLTLTRRCRSTELAREAVSELRECVALVPF